MNKQDLVYEVVRRTGLTARAVDLALNSTLSTISEQLSKGNTVTLSGFGAFSPQHRAARVGRNPHTKAPVPIPACYKPKFKASRELVEALRSLERSQK